MKLLEKRREVFAPSSGAGGVVVEGLVKSFGATPVLTGLDFEVKSGTMLAVLGPNGAGKTTTVRILTTLLRPDGGRAFVGGYDVVEEPMKARSVLGLTGQRASVDGLLTGRENLVMIGRLLRLDIGGAHDRADELLELLDLVDAANRQVKTYSGGMRRRLDLAASLVATPPIMFLDEPTTGLDPMARKNIWDIIRGLMREGTTVVLTTQYLEEADRLADRIVVMDNGGAVLEGTPQSLKRRVGSERADLTLATPRDRMTVTTLLGDQLIIEQTETTLGLAINDPWQLNSILTRLRVSGIKPVAMTVTQPTLDDVFFAVAGTRVDGQRRETA
jgi:daunorubicin resistance ABC transporter ATP-binding subunit